MNNLNFVPFQNAKKEKIKSQFEHEVRTWLDKRGRHYIIVTGCQFRGDCRESEREERLLTVFGAQPVRVNLPRTQTSSGCRPDS